MLKHGEANPLNVFGLREVSHLPPHFTTIVFDLAGAITSTHITNWIYENLSGRYYFSPAHYSRNNSLNISACVAFEIPNEATYFSILLPTLNKPTH